jgi:Mrp family chromosome partitioning ATPase
VDGFVYLRTTPDTCLSRGQKRGRAEEAGVPLSYLQELHARHEEWLLPLSRTAAKRAAAALADASARTIAAAADLEAPKFDAASASCVDLSVGLSADGVPVLVVDCDLEFEGDPQRLEKVGAAIDRFCASVVQPRFVQC